MFANGLGDQGSILGRALPKTQKMVLDATLLNTQHYKVKIKAKWNNPGKGVAPNPTFWCRSYRKGSLQVTLDYSRQLYLLIWFQVFPSNTNNLPAVIWCQVTIPTMVGWKVQRYKSFWNSIIRLSSNPSVLTCVMNYEFKWDYMDIRTFQYSKVAKSITCTVISCWRSEWEY